MTAVRNLALEALKACTIYACAGGDGAMKNRHLAAIAALEAETGEPVAPYAWCIASTNSADWCFAAERSGVELNAFMMDKDCVKTPAFPLYTTPPPAVPQWLPIESAPKNGTSVLVISKGVLWPSVAYFCNNHWYWSTSAGWAGFPTHWMPLPAAPEAPK